MLLTLICPYCQYEQQTLIDLTYGTDCRTIKTSGKELEHCDPEGGGCNKNYEIFWKLGITVTTSALRTDIEGR